ncbi:hypothetical protein FC756_24040 [Lysinibacillus mangiferihumi]|uniref:Uncharacterized protein n=1 Tax=Lysinibacillus mangiferihumi TaxID=1130819 RepID=A0A4U2XZG3_9BACI|nr:hypothetical protein [Lysinibacillus mangiferihumi]TKI53418.1 hypothetical protein FC756_24040 [Lysinibacillus mangiferihumi]
MDFDINAFIINDKSASNFPANNPWKAGTKINEIKNLQKEIDKSLEDSLEGIRKVDKKGRPDKFTIRIYTQKNLGKNISRVIK